MNNNIITTLLLIFSTYLLPAQTRDDYLNDAQEDYMNEDFDKASQNYQHAFKLKESKDYIDYYYAALSAIQSDQKDQALVWLSRSVALGLGTSQAEIDYLTTQEEFKPLHQEDTWNLLIAEIKQNIANKILKDKSQKEKWLNDIIQDDLIPGSYQLRYSLSTEYSIPYLIYLPKNFSPNTKLPLITYLHGGVGLDEFYETYTNPELKNEPVFNSADNLNAIVIYPIAKKKFNWLYNEEILYEIQQIVLSTVEKFNIDRQNILIGGMSNGGRAAFWYPQHSQIFTGYYSFSGHPSLEFDNIDFSKIKKPFISVNGKLDEIFQFEGVQEIYKMQIEKSSGWKLKPIEGGNHGFIYDKSINGQEIVTETLKELLH